MGEEIEISEERIEEEMKKIRDEMLAIYEPIRLELVKEFEAHCAFLEEIRIVEKPTAARGRPKRNAFKNATSKISSQANPPSKLRRPDSTDGSNVNIYDHLNQKHEESVDKKILCPLKDSTNMTISSLPQDTSVILINDGADKIHKISDDENQMPPPKEPIKVPKKRGRKVKKEKISLSQSGMESDAETPIRRSSRLNITEKVPKVELITPIADEQHKELNINTKLVPESVEITVRAAMPLAYTQNDTMESVYEDAVGINTNVPDLTEDNCGPVPKIDDISHVSIIKAVESDKKLLRATVSLVRIETLKPVEEESSTPEQVQTDIEVISDIGNETFVKGHNPNITHIIKTEILSPEIQCNDRTIVIQSEEILPTLNSTVVIERNNVINQTFDVQASEVSEPESNVHPQIDTEIESKKSPNKSVETCNGVVEDSSLITDDDSEIDVNTNDNELFSSQSPVKCLVKAFEKVIASEASKPETRNSKKTQLLTEKSSTPTSSDTGSNNAIVSKLPTCMRKLNPTNTNTSQTLTKSKLYTPQASVRTLKGFTPLTKSTSKNCFVVTNNSISSTNVRNLVTTGITTFLPKVNPTKTVVNKEEVLKKQQAKEDEAKRKKEQILHDKQEELKRKRMEKERVVQQARDQQAKEKQIQLEEKTKEKEKKLILLQEREEKKKEEKRLKQLKKDEEEAEQLRTKKQQAEEVAEKERKRQAQNKAKLLKLQEQKKQLEKQMNSENANSVPKTAMTDGFENLGSDYSTDDEERPSKFQRPKWSAYEQRQYMLTYQSVTAHTLIDNIFQMELTTPNLKEIFPKIEKEKLQRKSSAVWRTPPRYSVLQKY